jgi:2-polyprenyl-3-methyl-5-hydroxy-6-metoxy-1,4-benzoquinol methylase
MNDLEWTGERLVTQINSIIIIEHLHRYAIAKDLITPEDLVLDIACGEGYGCSLMAKKAKTVFGVDISEKTVEHAIRKYTTANCNFKIGSVTDIPFDNQLFDVVSSFETIEHIAEHEKMMQEVNRVMKPNGLFIVSSPDKMNYADIPNYKNPFHVKELYKNEFIELVSRYFTHIQVLSQNASLSSIIAPEESADGFVQYNGDFKDISNSSTVTPSVYNLIIASNAPIPQLPASVFDGNLVFRNMRNEWSERNQEQIALYNELKNSKTYRLGDAILSPFKFIRDKVKFK